MFNEKQILRKPTLWPRTKAVAAHTACQISNLIHSFIHCLSLTFPLQVHIKWLTPSGPCRATTCRDRELTLTHIHIFWAHKDMEGFPGWGISSMPGLPPRRYEHERRYTIYVPILSNKANMKGWLWPPNDIREPCSSKASRHLSYRWRKTAIKISPKELIPTRNQTRVRWVTGAHAIACSTAVDGFDSCLGKNFWLIFF